MKEKVLLTRALEECYTKMIDRHLKELLLTEMAVNYFCGT